MLALRGAAAVLLLLTLTGGVPWLARVGLAAAFGLWAAMIAGGDAALANDAGAMLLVAARELVIGATLGVVAAVPLVAAQAAGRLIDIAGGASGRQGPYAGLFAVLAAAVFVGIDGHVAVVRAIVESFASVPVVVVAGAPGRVLDALGGLLPAAVALAIPWLVTAAVVELAAGAGVRLAGRAGAHVPGAVAVPAALVMMTATLVATTAVGIAALVRSAIG